ncbi:DUF4435 domain-containing protein [Streptococcus parasanguinis]|jgi:hypothetical protein|uniref:DUF4435 domain-containing protein n=1 Tax=Streptococcus parasanguinis TaxID=1318 RepID=UPI00066D7312|nr:DUF4435 domain-containing protein [Streptococcus parasanguinis]MBT0907081.1 DUF4435 domain-containing protein [Streptococcus parasanguinis]
MSRKDKMNEEADCIEAIFLSYTQTKSSQKMFLFFEGTDDFKYYCPRISILCNEKEYKKYDCNGKQNVLRIYDMITNQTQKDSKTIKMFFVDKDFDDNSNIDNEIYVTPTYSIENLYFTDIAIKKMILAEMGLSEHSKYDKDDFITAYNYIIGYRNKIIKDMLYGNACYSLQIKKSLGMGINKPNLTPIKRYDEIVKILKPEDIESRIKGYIEISEAEIVTEYERLNSDSIRLIRGKYLLEKMPKCINKIVEESNKGVNHEGHLFSKKRCMRLNTSESSLISDLSNYAETPRCLINYIQERCSVI